MSVRTVNHFKKNVKSLSVFSPFAGKLHLFYFIAYFFRGKNLKCPFRVTSFIMCFGVVYDAKKFPTRSLFSPLLVLKCIPSKILPCKNRGHLLSRIAANSFVRPADWLPFEAFRWWWWCCHHITEKNDNQEHKNGQKHSTP